MPGHSALSCVFCDYRARSYKGLAQHCLEKHEGIKHFDNDRHAAGFHLGDAELSFLFQNGNRISCWRCTHCNGIDEFADHLRQYPLYVHVLELSLL